LLKLAKPAGLPITAEAEENSGGKVRRVGIANASSASMLIVMATQYLVKVQQTGAACHEGYRSCFFRQLDQGTITITEPRLAQPDQIYKKS
jgi:hypothetical protein